ncbi:mitochondrial protein cyt-4 [Annulohypoxylon maeteangense]|uniref:mitochondrial protein cyt-4 n=1 Tax=Annulohypoxylon maeteangense TaxID=1927788 RepID=UPI00200879F7|nr:mitochondrial protein cyt-4 [Annulohypoxylon maeteangense]KAI0890000.1 mitochondrial protein cyt-4 [Annulohypoxylon maeteangense]
MLRTSARAYVCWRCAFQRPTSNLVKSEAKLLPRTKNHLWRRNLATVQKSNISDDGPHFTLGGTNKKNIRERLRRWEERHQDEVHTILADYADAGELSNNFTRPQNVAMATFDVASPLFDGDELGDLRSEDANLKPGDMVELSSDSSRRPMMAICLGRFNGYEHYYTSSGKWFSGLGVKTLFIVNNFVEPSELQPVIDELPNSEIPLEALNALQDLNHNPSRATGAELLRKMLNFAHEAEAVYQENAATLDASSSFIGDPETHRYLTLHEIAQLLLPKSYRKNGKFKPEALYAVHRALLQNEVFFRPLRQTGHKRSYLFEISPLSEVRIVQRAETMIREYLERQARLSDNQESTESPVLGFVERARELIDQSRKSREWTGAGIIGPSTAPKSKSAPLKHEWSVETDVELLQFIELWASYQKFPSYSRLQCYGSTILRALDRYQDAEFLSASTGWTFLQEVGWIPSWEIPARYNIRFPGVEIKRGGGYIRPFSDSLHRHLKSDALAAMRKTWDGVTAYCIDAETTVDIDDAVSLERTDNPDRNWIHIHVADPASSIQPNTPVAKFAELIPQTIYLPGHFERMLPTNIGSDIFSLAPGRPCLTFSALVSKDGSLKDYKITPGTLKDVVYMTGEDVALAIEDEREDPLIGDTEMMLGPTPKETVPARQMTRPHDLSSQQKDELALLSELGKAIQVHRLRQGATPFFQPRPEAQAYFDHLPTHELDNFLSLVGDPSIRIGYSQRTGTDLVENAMKLAGEIAARWCYNRGIPIPYLTQPHAVKNTELVQQYTREVFYPLLKGGIRPDDSQWRHLRALIGSDELTTVPSPHFTLGVDMYTKATSPLRRFSDLLVHWQIEAALQEEHRRGASLVGNQEQDFLPFDRKHLDRMLPMLRVREKQARALTSGIGGDQWILQALVRAWRFGQAPIPETFRFSVDHVIGRSAVTGKLDWFERPARLRPDAMNDLVRIADVRVGDVYEVKLRDVNVHANRIMVEAVSIISKAELDPPTLAPSSETQLEIDIDGLTQAPPTP